MKFSVAMCVYGGDNPSYFDEALNSVISNTVLPDEIIIVIDGPVSIEHDNVLKKYSYYIKQYRFDKNMGHGIARRKSLELCNNDLVAIMDADDICCPDRFQKQLKAFCDNPNVSVVGGQIEEFTDDIQNVTGKRIVPLNDKDIKEFLKKRCPMNMMTVMFKKEDVQSVGGFIDWYCEEDYYLWIRMFQSNKKFANLNTILVHVRVGNDMYKRRGGFRYFESEYKLQKYMLNIGITDTRTFLTNVMKRFFVQLMLPKSLRAYVYGFFLRSN